jgi:hypothetical protein
VVMILLESLPQTEQHVFQQVEQTWIWLQL